MLNPELKAELKPGLRLAVFSIKKNSRGDAIWVRVGNAWVNKDLSLNVYLDVLPMHGTLHLRETPDTRKEMADLAAIEAASAPVDDRAMLAAATAQQNYRATLAAERAAMTAHASPRPLLPEPASPRSLLSAEPYGTEVHQ